MTDETTPDRVLQGAEFGDETEPECQIRGCDRTGTVPQEMPHPDRDDETIEHYICRRHQRIIQAIKAGIAVVAVGLFLWVVYGQF